MSTKNDPLVLTPETVHELTSARFESSNFSYANYVSSDPKVQNDFLQNAKRIFSQNRTTPTPVTITLSDFHSNQIGLEAGDYLAWKIIQREDEIVFYDEKADAFGKATQIDEGKLYLLDIGHRSKDPFEIFLA